MFREMTNKLILKVDDVTDEDDILIKKNASKDWK